MQHEIHCVGAVHWCFLGNTARNSNHQVGGRLGFLTEVLGINKNQSTGREEWLIGCPSVWFGYSFIQFLYWVSSSTNTQQNLSDFYPLIFQTWLNLRLDINHPVELVGSWRQTNHHITLQCSLIHRSHPETSTCKKFLKYAIRYQVDNIPGTDIMISLSC